MSAPTTKPPFDDAENDAIHAVRRGDSRAFEHLVDAHLDSLRAFIALRLPAPHLIDEIAHESFVFAYRRIEDFEPGTSFRAWLRAIATNLVRAEIQRYAREQAGRFRHARAELLEQESGADPTATAGRTSSNTSSARTPSPPAPARAPRPSPPPPGTSKAATVT